MSHIKHSINILKPPCVRSARVDKINRIILAIRKHICAQDRIACIAINIRINKPSGIGVVIAALEVVKSGVCVIDIAAVTQGVEICYVVRVGCRRTVAS